MKDIEEDGQNIDIPSGPRFLLDMEDRPANDSENYNDKNGAGNNAENDDNPSVSSWWRSCYLLSHDCVGNEALTTRLSSLPRPGVLYEDLH